MNDEYESYCDDEDYAAYEAKDKADGLKRLISLYAYAHPLFQKELDRAVDESRSDE
jgi:hypothetical protein